MSKAPSEMSRHRVTETLAPFYESAAQRIEEERQARKASEKSNPRPVHEVHCPAGFTRLEAGFWFAYPKDGEPGKLGPFEAAPDAARAFDERSMKGAKG